MSDHHKYSNSEHWNGQHYQMISSPQYTINMKFIRQFKMKGNETVLDIGCGNGDTTREIALLVPNGNVLGIDASSSMVTEAITTQPKENLSFQLMNAHDMCFDSKFDIISSFFCMQWVQDKKMVFSKIQSALKVGGSFLMITPMPHPHLPNIRKKVMGLPHWKPYFSSYQDPLSFINDNNYESLAKESSLRITKAIIEHDPVYFANYELFFDFMYEMTPNIKQIPSQELKNAFMHELLDEYMKIYSLNPKGELRLDFKLQKMICTR